MINNKVWLAFVSCVVAVSAVTIKDFKAEQVNSTAHVLLAWEPSSTPPNLKYKLEYQFLNKRFNTIIGPTVKSKDVLLKFIYCCKADFKLTPIVDEIPGASIETSLTFPEGKKFKLDQLISKTNKHNNGEQIIWTVNNQIMACKHQFLVTIFYPFKKFLTNETTYTIKDPKPNKKYIVRVRHVFSDGSLGPQSSTSFLAKYGGSEPEKVEFESIVDFGKVDLRIQPLRYEKTTPVKNFVVSYVSGVQLNNVTFQTTDRHISITNYQACQDFTVEIFQVTKDSISSEPTRKVIQTRPHTPIEPRATGEHTPGGIILNINGEAIQGNKHCPSHYEVKALYPDGKVGTTLWTYSEAKIQLKMSGNYTFAVRKIVDKTARSKVSEVLKCVFSNG